MRKRMTAVLLALSMALSLLPAAAFAAPNGEDPSQEEPPETAAPKYSDVADDYWGKEAIDAWSDRDVVSGTGDGTFKPDDTMDRAQMATAVARLLRLSGTADLSAFTDLQAGAWYYDYVAQCVAEKIVYGTGESTMEPGKVVTREQIFTAMCRAFGLNGDAEVTVESKFTDLDEAADWSRKYINMLVNYGMVNGTTETTVEPVTPISRASVMQLLFEMIGVYANKDGETYEIPAKGFLLIVADNVKITGKVTDLPIIAYREGGHVDMSGVKGAGVVHVRASNMTFTGVPAGTRFIIGEGVTGTIVNGKEVTGDYTVPGRGGSGGSYTSDKNEEGDEIGDAVKAAMEEISGWDAVTIDENTQDDKPAETVVKVTSSAYSATKTGDTRNENIRLESGQDQGIASTVAAVASVAAAGFMDGEGAEAIWDAVVEAVGGLDLSSPDGQNNLGTVKEAVKTAATEKANSLLYKFSKNGDGSGGYLMDSIEITVEGDKAEGRKAVFDTSSDTPEHTGLENLGVAVAEGLINNIGPEYKAEPSPSTVIVLKFNGVDTGLEQYPTVYRFMLQLDLKGQLFEYKQGADPDRTDESSLHIKFNAEHFAEAYNREIGPVIAQQITDALKQMQNEVKSYGFNSYPGAVSSAVALSSTGPGGIFDQLKSVMTQIDFDVDGDGNADPDQYDAYLADVVGTWSTDNLDEILDDSNTVYQNDELIGMIDEIAKQAGDKLNQIWEENYDPDDPEGQLLNPNFLKSAKPDTMKEALKQYGPQYGLEGIVGFLESKPDIGEYVCAALCDNVNDDAHRKNYTSPDYRDPDNPDAPNYYSSVNEALNDEVAPVAQDVRDDPDTGPMLEFVAKIKTLDRLLALTVNDIVTMPQQVKEIPAVSQVKDRIKGLSKSIGGMTFKIQFPSVTVTVKGADLNESLTLSDSSKVAELFGVGADRYDDIKDLSLSSFVNANGDDGVPVKVTTAGRRNLTLYLWICTDNMQAS